MNIIHAFDAALSNRPPHIQCLAHHMSHIWEMSDLNPYGENDSRVFFFGKSDTHGSVHRESNLITVQQVATYSVYYISVGSSTCFGC